MFYDFLESPLGKLLLVCDEIGLVYVDLPTTSRPMSIMPEWMRDSYKLQVVKSQLVAYFNGDRFEFDLPLNPHGTQFQKQVWAELVKIPYGETISYGELARRIGNTKASRAVGLANGANPIAIIVPCHRVIGANGSLTGYAGGLAAKQFLLGHERHYAPPVKLELTM